ncbi:hypothetical protein IEO21_03812 [Rhodonia placenta]|uniref:Uncharacterized protein n=1 Tax=Rhodonia placenta TaxID=104341 RepID=A0A8H7P594_9APHY|nr:hypothetical protein IEO21_03812 [Postia placenta]
MSDLRFEYSPARHDADGSTDGLLLKDRSSTSTRLTPDWKTFRRAIPWIAHGVLIFISVSLFLLSVRLNDTRCARKLSVYSPAMDAVEYHNVKFNGTLTWPSEFRGTPSPELDAAWKRIAADSEGFPRQNMLRKRTYFEHYAADDVSILAGPGAYRTHLARPDRRVIDRYSVRVSVGRENRAESGWRGFARPPVQPERDDSGLRARPGASLCTAPVPQLDSSCGGDGGGRADEKPDVPSPASLREQIMYMGAQRTGAPAATGRAEQLSSVCMMQDVFLTKLCTERTDGGICTLHAPSRSLFAGAIRRGTGKNA